MYYMSIKANMEVEYGTKDYIVSRIEGEYAYLKRTDIESEEELFIAMALLPLGVDIGTKLHYECMEYSII